MAAITASPGAAAYAAVLRSYEKAGEVEGAIEWLDKMAADGIRLDQGAYSAVLKACQVKRDLPAAEQWLERMESDGILVDRSSYVTVVRCAALAGDADAAARWIEVLDRQPGMKAFADVHNAVLHAFAEAGDVPGAAAWFDQMPAWGVAPNARTYDAMIQACAEAGQPAAAVEWFRRMDAEGFEPLEGSYSEVIIAHLKAKQHQRAEVWFNRSMELRTLPTGSSFASVLNACVKAGQTRRAMRWFERFVASGAKPDVRCYTSVISICAENGHTQVATRWLKRMAAEGLKVDAISYNAVLKAFHYRKDAAGVTEMFGQMVNAGISPDEYSFGYIVSTLAEVGDIEGMSVWADRMQEHGHDPSRLPYDKIVKSLAAAKQGQSAREWLERASDNGGKGASNEAYGAVVKALLTDGLAEEARGLLNDMRKRGKGKGKGKARLRPQMAVYITFFRHYAKVGDEASAQAAADLHEEMVSDGVSATAETHTCVLTAFAKCGDKQKVFEWLETMVTAGIRPDERTYTSVINVFANLGDTTGAAEWLEKMVTDGLRPDVATYTTVLKSYLQRGDVFGAARWLEWMEVDKVQADTGAYNYVLGGFAASGNLSAAEQVFDRMSAVGVQPTELSFNHLLDCCAKARVRAAARRWLKAMEEADIKPGGIAYAAMARVHAADGRVKEAEQFLQKMINEDKPPMSVKLKTVEYVMGIFQLEGKEEPLQRLADKYPKVFEHLEAQGTVTDDELLSGDGGGLAAAALAPAPPAPGASGRGGGGRRSGARSAGVGRRSTSLEQRARKTKRRLSKRPGDSSAAGDRSSLEAAMQQFNKIRLKGEPSINDWHDVLRSFAGGDGTAPRARLAVAWIKKMREAGVELNAFSYMTLLGAFAEAGDSGAAVQWFERMVGNGITPLEGHFQHAVRAIKRDAVAKGTVQRPINETQMLERLLLASSGKQKGKVRSYDFIVRKLAEYGDTNGAAAWYDRAKAEGMFVSSMTCEIAAKASMEDGSETKTLFWLEEIPQTYGEDKLKTSITAFVRRIALGGKSLPDDAALDAVAAWMRRISLAKLDKKDVPYETFISLYSSSKRLAEASAWFNKLIDSGQSPTLEAYKDMIRCSSECRRPDTARKWMETLKLTEHKLDTDSYNSLLKSYIFELDVEGAVACYNEMVAEGLTPDAVSNALMIKLFSRVGDCAGAERWYAAALNTNHTLGWDVYESLIHAHLDAGDLSSALDRAKDLSATGKKTGAKIWVAQLRAASEQAGVQPDLVKQVVREMVRNGHEPGKQAMQAMERVLGRTGCRQLCDELGVDLDKLLRTH